MRDPQPIDMLKSVQELTDKPLQRPRGLCVPVMPPPRELSATPGVTDAAERSVQRAQLVDAIRVQQESLPVMVADDAFRGAVAGSLTGLGLLVLRCLLTGQVDAGQVDTGQDDVGQDDDY